MSDHDHGGLNPRVFFPAAGAILLFVVVGVFFTQPMQAWFGAIQGWIVTQFGWFYILSVTAFLVFVLWLSLSRFGSIRLGRDDEEPEYGTLTWFAMLFSAGMGIGLLFFSVAEPMMHFTSPPRGDAETVAAALDRTHSLEAEADAAAQAGNEDQAQALHAEAAQVRETLYGPAQRAMTITFFHWGLHAWAIYIVVGLALSYFSYRHGLPLTIRSTLYPLLGSRIYGPIGDLVEVLAVFGTLFGVATSLGLGVQQINAGLDFLGIISISTQAQIVLIVLVTTIATVSVVSGLDLGIRRLSELNLGLSMFLILFVLIAGPTAFLLSDLVQSVGTYVASLPEVTFRTDAMRGTAWQSGWTMFYWGWWISWSPFVGMFIARVSRGRTIRSFIGGVLIAPVLLTFVWLTIFGGTAIHLELFEPSSQIIETMTGTADGTPRALFAMLQELPMSAVTGGLAVIVITTYFVTSSDSASLVIDILTHSGNPEPPTWSRVFWAVTEGAVAAVLLLIGGSAALGALQTAALTTALPFVFVMLVICWSLVKGLAAEEAATEPGVPLEIAAPEVAEQAESAEEAGVAWRQRLGMLLKRPSGRAKESDKLRKAREEAETFIRDQVLPAFQDIRKELEAHGRTAKVDRQRQSVTIVVRRDDVEEFRYTIRTRMVQQAASAFPEFQHRMDTPRVVQAAVISPGGMHQHYPLPRLTRPQIIEHFIHEYAKWVNW